MGNHKVRNEKRCSRSAICIRLNPIIKVEAMPVTNLREDTGGPMDWFNALPKLSKYFAGSLVISGACLTYRIPAVFFLFLDWKAATYKLQVRQFQPADNIHMLDSSAHTIST